MSKRRSPEEIELNMTVPIRYVKLNVIIKRKKKIIGYRTSYTPYRTERPIQPET